MTEPGGGTQFNRRHEGVIADLYYRMTFSLSESQLRSLTDLPPLREVRGRRIFTTSGPSFRPSLTVSAYLQYLLTQEQYTFLEWPGHNFFSWGKKR
jgi:hypothetical protein